MSNVVMLIAFAVWGASRLISLEYSEDKVVTTACRMAEVIGVGTILAWIVLYLESFAYEGMIV